MAITVADVTATDQPLVYANHAFERLTRYPAADILGRNGRFLQAGQHDPQERAAIRAAIADGRAVDMLILNFRGDRRAFWNEFHLSPGRNAAGRVPTTSATSSTSPIGSSASSSWTGWRPDGLRPPPGDHVAVS